MSPKGVINDSQHQGECLQFSGHKPRQVVTGMTERDTPAGILSVSQAARAWKKSRAWLYTKRDQGKLSFSTFPDGSPGIDAAEMLRVFGPAAEQKKDRKRKQQDTAPTGGETTDNPDVLRERLEHVTELLRNAERVRDDALERERAMLDERAKMLDMLDRQTRLLAHQPPAPPLPTIDPESIEGASKKKLRKLLKRLLGS